MSKSLFTVTLTHMRFAPTSRVLEEANHILLEANKAEVWKERRNASGEKLPKGIDLFESGDLKDDSDSSFDGYTFFAPHAEYVDRRYRFAGLSDRALAGTERQLSELFNKYNNNDLIEDEEEEG